MHNLQGKEQVRVRLPFDRDRGFPGTFGALDGVIVFPWNHRYTEEHVDYIARSIRDAVASLES